MKALVRALAGAMVAAATVPALADINIMNRTGEAVCVAWATTRGDCAMLDSSGSTCLQQAPFVQRAQGWKCANHLYWMTIPTQAPTIVVAKIRRTGRIIETSEVGVDTRLRVHRNDFLFDLSWFGGAPTGSLAIRQPNFRSADGTWAELGNAFDGYGYFEADAMSFGAGNWNVHLD